MTEETLKQFVENMRSSGMTDEAIEQDLQNANHPQATIDVVLGKAPDSVKAAEEIKNEEAQTIDPSNRPKIIKDRSDRIRKGSDDSDDDPGDGEAPAGAAANSSTRDPDTRVVVTPTGNLKPDEAEPKATEDEEAEPAPTEEATPKEEIEDDNPNSIDAVMSGVSSPPKPDNDDAEPTTASIYPEVSKGVRSAEASSGKTTKGVDINLPDKNYPKFESNPLAVLAYSVSKFLKNAPVILVAIIIGIALGIVFTRLLTFVGEKVAEFLSETGAGFIGLGDGWGAFAAYLLIITFVYSVLIAVFLTLWRTVQLSIILDVVKGDDPDLEGALNRLFTWFGRIFSAMFRLIFKIALVFDVIYLSTYWYAFSRLESEGFGALRYIVWGLYVFLFAAAVIAIRNSFVHFLMLDKSSNRASEASSSSVQLVTQPRQKYFELFAWAGLIALFYQALRLVFVMVFKEDPTLTFAPFNVVGDLGQYNNLAVEIAGATIGTLIVALSDIGLGRYYISSKGLLRTARSAGGVNVMNFVVIIVAIVAIYGGNRTIDNIRADQIQSEYETFLQDNGGLDQSGDQSTFNFDDLDNNGILDEKQCDAGSFPFPALESYNEQTGQATYSIQCQ